MAHIHSNALIGASGAAGAAGDADYIIPKSLRFNSGDSAHLSKTFASAGNRRTWTWSGWVKRCTADASNHDRWFAVSGTSTDTCFFIGFADTDDKLSIQFGYVPNYKLITNAVFRDPSAWYHVVLAVDVTQSAASDKVKVYVNGVEQTSFSTDNRSSISDTDWGINKAGLQHEIGKSFSSYLNGYLADVHFVDGQQLAPTDFGETRSSDGVWVPKEYTGTYDGFNKDQTWSTYGSVTAGTFSPTIAALFDNDDSTGPSTGANTLATWTFTQAITASKSIHIYAVNGSGSSGTQASNTEIRLTVDGTVHAIDGAPGLIDTGLTGNLTAITINVGQSGSPGLRYIKVDGLELVDPSVATVNNGFHLNFNDSSTNEALGFDFAPTIPDLNPKDGMDVITYTGTYARLNVGGLNFEPGLVWIKNRDSGTSAHFLADSVRGGTKVLQSNSTGTENTRSNHILSFNPDGFTLGADGTSNYPSGNSFVAWTWRAGGPAVTNTDGTITTEVSANTDYGFSIIKYTGVNNASAQTIGHGLGKVPKWVLIKNLTDAEDWAVYHASVGNTKYLQLNSTAAAATSSAYWNDTDPTSSLITLNNSNDVQRINRDYIVYAWSEVSGYSKFSSYSGTGSSGNAVTTGFKPKFVLIKHVDGAHGWYLYDSERSNGNAILEPNSSGAEYSGGNSVVFNDNGFTVDATSADLNSSGNTYIYAAFADRPGNNWDVNNIVTNEGLTTSKTQFDVVTYTGNGGTQKIGGPVFSASAASSITNPGNIFDGSTSTGGYSSSTGTDLTLTTSSFTISTQLRVYNNFRSDGTYAICLNGTCVTIAGSGTDSTQYRWSTVDLSGFTLPLTVTSLGYSASQASGNTIRAVEVDSSILIDGTQPGLKFKPDFVWIKSRSSGNYGHMLFDSVRGPANSLYSQDSGAEGHPNAYGKLNSFNSDGFTVAPGSSDSTNVNANNATYVAWCWNAGDAKIPQLYGTAATVTSTAALSTTLIGPATPNGDSESINYQNLDIDLQEDVTTVSIKVKYAASPITYLVSADGTNWTSKSTGNSMTALSTITISHSSAFRYVRFHYPNGNFGQAFQVINNTDGNLASTVKANSQYGFSVVSYLGTGSAATVGHGLTKPPSLIIVKQRDGTNSWAVYSRPTGASGYLSIEDNSALNTSVSPWDNTDPTSSVFSIATAPGNNAINRVNLSGKEYVAYCFANIPGYQQIGTYYTNSSDPIVITGFKPRFLLVKKYNGAGNWMLLDSQRSTDDDDIRTTFEINNSNGEETHANRQVKFLNNGFQLIGADMDTSNSNWLYWAIGDDEIGSDEDCLVDVPNAVTADADATDTTGGYQRGNYATMNPLHSPTGSSFSNGNLQVSNSGGWYSHTGTIGVASGKWYYEFEKTSGSYTGVGWRNDITTAGNPSFNANGGGIYLSHNGNKQSSAGSVSYGATWGSGDIVGVAFDCDAGTIEFYKNGVSQGQAFTGMTDGTFFPEVQIYQSGGVINFGQMRFKYPMPSGYAALNTTALPAATIADGSAQFETKLYTANATARSLTGYEFAPDWLWFKPRNVQGSHNLYDTVRGATKGLRSHATDAEYTDAQTVTSFNSDGFSLGTDSGGYQVNYSNNSMVVWAWNAGSSTVSNTDGSITSSVRANPAAGFSIVSYTGNATAGATVGHGLNDVPAMYINKRRDSADGWYVYHKDVTTGKVLILNVSDAENASSFTNSTEPTNSVFTLGSADAFNASGSPFITYCFAPVAGYSAIGSYEGTGSAGNFVYTGFRVGWLLLKNADGTNSWQIMDTTREPLNQNNVWLQPNTTTAEQDNSAIGIDFLSNGFCLRGTDGGVNGSGNTYVYYAVAENPFQANGGLAR